jgi:hypothetical protein
MGDRRVTYEACSHRVAYNGGATVAGQRRLPGDAAPLGCLPGGGSSDPSVDPPPGNLCLLRLRIHPVPLLPLLPCLFSTFHHFSIFLFLIRIYLLFSLFIYILFPISLRSSRSSPSPFQAALPPPLIPPRPPSVRPSVPAGPCPQPPLRPASSSRPPRLPAASNVRFHPRLRCSPFCCSGFLVHV